MLFVFRTQNVHVEASSQGNELCKYDRKQQVVLHKKKVLFLFLCTLIVLLLSACQVINTSPVITIEPYLIYTDDNREMKVMWHLLDKMESTIEWGTDTSYS